MSSINISTQAFVVNSLLLYDCQNVIKKAKAHLEMEFVYTWMYAECVLSHTGSNFIFCVQKINAKVHTDNTIVASLVMTIPRISNSKHN